MVTYNMRMLFFFSHLYCFFLSYASSSSPARFPPCPPSKAQHQISVFHKRSLSSRSKIILAPLDRGVVRSQSYSSFSSIDQPASAPIKSPNFISPEEAINENHSAPLPKNKPARHRPGKSSTVRESMIDSVGEEKRDDAVVQAPVTNTNTISIVVHQPVATNSSAAPSLEAQAQVHDVTRAVAACLELYQLGKKYRWPICCLVMTGAAGTIGHYI